MANEYEGFGLNAKVLMFLLENGRVKRRAFQENGFNYSSAIKSLEGMETVGVTRYEATGDRYDTVYWSLTDKGMKAAQMLKELDEFIQTG